MRNFLVTLKKSIAAKIEKVLVYVEDKFLTAVKKLFILLICIFTYRVGCDFIDYFNSNECARPSVVKTVGGCDLLGRCKVLLDDHRTITLMKPVSGEYICTNKKVVGSNIIAWIIE